MRSFAISLGKTLRFKNTRKTIFDAVKRIKKNDKTLKRIGTSVVRNIKVDSLEGRSYDGRSFPPLKNSTIKYRKYIEKYNNMSKDYSLRKSNVTMIGDLLNNIRVYIKSGLILIEARGRHKAYMGKRGRHKTRAPYSDILKGLWDLDRRLLGLSKESKKKIILEVKREVKRGLRKQA